jgi:carboxyl-terminal processing protease
MRKLQLAAVCHLKSVCRFNTDDNKLVEDAITGMLEKLDPHSAYTDPEETKEMTNRCKATSTVSEFSSIC